MVTEPVSMVTDQNLPPLPPQPTKVSFDAPQNWGSSSTEQTSQNVILSLGVSNHGNPEKTSDMPASVGTSSDTKESTGISIVKILLIALGLVLLGVLLGILAANFFQPVQTPTPSPAQTIITQEAIPSVAIMVTPIILTPTATPEALLKLNWKTYVDSTYKLFYPSTWTRKSAASGFTLTKGSVKANFNVVDTATYSCGNPAIATISKGLVVWEIQESSPSSIFNVCSQGNGQELNMSTNIQLTGSKITSVDLDEFKYLLEKIEIL